MAINKKIVCALFLTTLLCSANFASAQQLRNPLNGINTFPQLLEKITTGVAEIVGSLAVLMLIIAGILFLFSAGNPNVLGRAKTALAYAIIGGAVCLAASGLVALIKKIIGA